MLDEILVGSAASACNITIHALVMAVVVRVANAVSGKTIWSPMLLLIGTMIATVLVPMAAHTSEVLVWAVFYWIADAAPAGAALVYFAFVNYTTSATGTLSR